MTEDEIKQATCQVVGKDEFGTGWLVAADLVLTAYHCVENAIPVGAPISVQFGIGSSLVEYAVVPGPCNKDLDVCLLQLSAPLSVTPIRIDTAELRPGEKWFAFGYPAAKLQLGHVVRGEIQQVLPEPVHGIDLDLSVEQGTHLTAYRGLSGAAFMVGPACKGLLQISVDIAIGAISFFRLKPFLQTNGLIPNEPVADEETGPVGARPVFDRLFESAIVNKRGGYVFLDGSHGVGKSTYCQQFIPEAPELDKLGVYHFTEPAHGSTPAQQAQPEVFFDWVNSLHARKATGLPARLMKLSYSELIEQTDQVFQSLAMRCAKAGKVGVLFIDGINEAAAAGEETLKRFINLLPETVPDGLVLVITGVGLDSLAGSIGQIFQGTKRLTLPNLDQDIQYRVCRELLSDDKATAEVISDLCDRAMGHPLYLRYLADLVNSGASQSDIAELPVFSGSIRDYYETIWSRHGVNADVVNLLGIIARLRWGIPTSQLTSMLTTAESGAFPSTLLQIRHLLAVPESTAIYHPSFSEFVIHKTVSLDERIHERLAGFCNATESGDYGVLNRRYHELRGGRARRLLAIQHCDQKWVDDSVLLSAEPDVLLADIDETITAATLIGTATDIIRLLLLSQRLTFRYNTLFAQSAESVALALISLGKAESALRHVIRNGRLIVSPDEAFAVVNALTQYGNPEHAIEVLRLLQRDLDKLFEKIFSKDGGTVHEFLSAVNLRMHGFSLAHAAGQAPAFTEFLRWIIESVLRRPGGTFSREDADEVIRQLSGEMMGAHLCLQGEYRPFSTWPVPPEVDSRHQLLTFLQILAHAEMHSEHYGISVEREKLDLLLSDIRGAIDAPLTAKDRQFAYADSLIEAGAAPELVDAYSAGIDIGDGGLPFYDGNRAAPDEIAFERAMLRLRASSYVETQCIVPTAQRPAIDDWERSLEAIARAVAWCDGKGRRAMGGKDQTALDTVWSYFADVLIPSLEFTLKSRIEWDSSYNIPETVIPNLYRRIAKLTLDCFPTKVAILLDVLERGFDVQLGLYNEGFRQTLQKVLRLFVERDLEGPDSDKVFSLVIRWRDYVAANVENRFELVPELLQIVPLLARLNASEEALRTYKSVLSFSMGPSWYKEDQLSMMTNTLAALPAEAPVQASSLAQIAGLLERATGEMTFQRYVRADKGSFIGQLCRRSFFSDAVRYFQHQSCGTTDELLSQATSGNLDRVSALVGMRFPGASLEEQASLLALLRHTRQLADWRLRWALLEVYQHGDERHLTDWGREYGAIISELCDSSGDLSQAKKRVSSITQSLNAERAWLLLKGLVSRVPSDLCPEFAQLLDQVESELNEHQIEQLTSMFGLRYEMHGTEEILETKSHATQVPDGVNESQAEDDILFIPGTFGKRAAVKQAEAQIEKACGQRNRGNFMAATQECLGALRTLQAGGWSIWTENHSGSSAEQFIRTEAENSDELAKMYGPLALEERHTQRWAIASHLISLVGKKASATQQVELLTVAIDHVTQLVGEASPAQFKYVGSSADGNASDALFELLLWTVDHPAWERRDAGAAMLLWLSGANSKWLPKLASLAVSMDRRNRADIASATLDILSRENAVGLWQSIEPHIEQTSILEQCRHVGRFSTFSRIAERASKCGVGSAAVFFNALQERFPEDGPIPTSATRNEPPKVLPPTLYRLWQDLTRLGLLSEGTLRVFDAQMVDSCSPMTVEMACELESLVAQGGRENPNLPTGRWATTIRYALSTALFQPMPASKLKRAEALLRTYNPETLVEPESGRCLLTNLVECIRNRREQSYTPSEGDLVFLDLHCILEMEQRAVQVELSSHLIPPGQHHPAPPTPPSFQATELARPGPDEPLAVCGRAQPTIAYFGTLSPAIPTPRFLQLLKTRASNTLRLHWRNGSSVTSLASSRRHETALLAIERCALVLPEGWQIIWILKLDGEVRALLNKF